MDEAWSMLAQVIELELGTPVVVRSRDQGVTVGTLAGAAGSSVALRNATHLHRWEGTGRGTGSVYDLISHPEARVQRSEPVDRIVILNVSDVTPISAARAAQLAASPRA